MAQRINEACGGDVEQEIDREIGILARLGIEAELTRTETNLGYATDRLAYFEGVDGDRGEDGDETLGDSIEAVRLGQQRQSDGLEAGVRIFDQMLAGSAGPDDYWGYAQAGLDAQQLDAYVRDAQGTGKK